MISAAGGASGGSTVMSIVLGVVLVAGVLFVVVARNRKR